MSCAAVKGPVKSVGGGGPMPTPDPLLFAVYHNDKYPKGNGRNVHAPRTGNGMDFNDGEYRMYHGKHIPGFPAHPHRGFETITATLQGFCDHCDSLGNAGRYGEGDCQFMTAGSGIQHSEMFPLVKSDQPNTLRLFQIWLNLPRADKMAPPKMVMHWANDVPKVRSPDGLATVSVYVGRYGTVAEALAPPPRSWAAKAGKDVAVWFVHMKPGARLELPAAHAGAEANRCLYVVEGDAVDVGGVRVPLRHMVDLDASRPVEVSGSQNNDTAALVLQGVPIGEPVAQRGPFVGNDMQDIVAAFSDYQETSFGGWPWPSEEHTFDMNKARFCLVDGVETVAPPVVPSSQP